MLSERAENILKERYYLPNEKSWSNICIRVADFIGDSYGERDEYYHELKDMKFIPNSPTLMNAGTDNPMLSACFYLPVEDSIEGIFDSIKYGAMIHKLGGGTGYNFSKLRPEGSKVGSTNGVASGPVSFMKIFDSATEQIKQGGKRRGANMGSLMVDHPDIKKFITCKSKEGDIKNFNISVWLTDEFMMNPDNEVMNLIVDGIYKNGEPGLLFYNTINAANPNPELGALEGVNPCAEAILLPYESCNLGSINLTKFVCYDSSGEPYIDYVDLKKTVHLAIRFLDKVIDKNKYPLEEIKEATKKTRKIGLGVMGFADMLLMMGIPYDSYAGLEAAHSIMRFINEEALNESIKLNSSTCIPKNSTRTTIAPTGTISILADVSSGIEPNFSFVYNRDNAAGSGLVVHPIFAKELKKIISLEPESDRQKIYENVIDHCFEHGSIRDIEWLPDEFKKVFVTAFDVPWEMHIRMQSIFQEHVNQSISKTINMPNNSTKEDIRKAILCAWKEGCKGLTIYREGSRQIEVNSLKKAVQNDVVSEKRPKEMFGVTYKALSGCGKLYVTINYRDKKPYEVFVFTGGNGGCQAQNQAIGRLISVALRNGVNYEVIVRQLNRVTCPVAIKNGCEGKSCSDIIGKLLKQSMGDEPERVHAVITSVEHVDEIPKNNHVCPECGGFISMSEGCRTCYKCGWSKCS